MGEHRSTAGGTSALLGRAAARRLGALCALALLPLVPVVAAMGAAGPAGASGHRAAVYVRAEPKGTAHVNEMDATGMNVTAAQALTEGDPGVTIAYIEGGINWHLGDAASLASVVYVNWHETPVPCDGATVATATMVVGGSTVPCATYYSPNESDYDPDGSGVVNAAQWAHDPRVTDANANGAIDPEDLIASFCTPAYEPPLDSAGLPCDISGWDFYDNQDDPATVDTAYQHANDQMDTIHSMCPDCTILPIKAGDEALDPTDNLAKAWQFAADEGARVIVSVTADLGYSSYMRQVVDELEAKGIVMVEASNDFDSTDHQGGMFWPYVIPGNGAVASQNGSQWVRSDLTSWGPKAEFTVATGGGSTSESTPTTGGVIGLLLSYGDEEYAAHAIAQPLSGPEAVQILQDTATPFTDTSLGWPGTATTAGAPDDWNEQYGYGMPNVYAAMQDVTATTVPAEAAIDSPDWYSTYDPTTTSSVPVTGHIDAATPTTTFSWTLQYATGGQPANAAFTTIGSGTGTGDYSGTLGTLALSDIAESYWGAPYAGTTDKELSNTTQYAVTFRLLVTDQHGNHSEDRRIVDVVHDPSLLPGYPKAIDPGSAGAGSAGPSGTDARASGDSSPQLADLQGTGTLDMVFGDSSGLVHAVDPATGDELPGWPVSTPPVPDVPPDGSGVDPGGQPVIANVAVGDLFHTGRQDVVVTTLDGTVEAFDAQGQLLPGWPQQATTGVVAPAIPRPALPNVRVPNRELTSAPVLVALGGGPQLDVVVAGGDGYLHAWTPGGQPVAGWPVKVQLPASFTLHSGYLLEDDQRLEATPTVAWLNGHDNPPDIVERSQLTQITGGGTQPLPYSEVFAYSAGGALLPNWPVTVSGLVEYYGSAQEEITEGSSSVVAADVNGSGDDVVVDSPVWSDPDEINGAGDIEGVYGDQGAAISTLLSTQSDGSSVCFTPDQEPTVPDAPIAFTSSGAFGLLGGKLSYAQSMIGSATFGCLQDPDAEMALSNYETAFPADASAQTDSTAPELAGYPGPRQGDGFLTSPIITDVTGGGQESVVEGGDSDTITAVSASGSEDAGFPKFTTGWDLWAPTAGDLLSDGHVDLVTATREGYLYAWATPGEASANDQWWSAHHDEWNTGNYGTSSRPPGALRDQQWTPGRAGGPGLGATGPVATFSAPGAEWYEGQVGDYLVSLAPSGDAFTVAPSGPAGTTQSIAAPPGTTGMEVQAVDASGALGLAAVFGTAPPAPNTARYTMVAADGGVFAFGGAGFYGSMGGRALNAPIVGTAATADERGYWEVASDGGIFSFGDAAFYGSMGGKHLNKPVVGLAATPDGGGYWEVASDGGVFSFGDAHFYGSMGGRPLNAPIVSIVPTYDGGGYWEVAADGGVFSFGDAAFLGSMGGQHLNRPIVAMATTPDGGGYWEVAADGGIFSFGDARFFGSTGGLTLTKPVVGLVATGDGAGYWLVAADGGVFSFGDAAFSGSTGGLHLVAPVVAASG